MDSIALLQELESLAEELGVEVRYEDFEGQGGLCRYGGRTCLIINRELPSEARLRHFCQALSRFSLEGVFVRPQVREFLQRGAARISADHI